MEPLRVAVLGCGFWSRFQIAAWQELPGVCCAAVCDPAEGKARATAERFGVERWYTDAERLLDAERIDVVDVISSPATHPGLVRLAAARGVPVICQKPMADDFQTAEGMVRVCRDAGVPFFVHENWRWQRPFRELQRVLASGAIGRPFRARLDFNSSFPVFDNQPFLKELERFIISDVGTHVLDVARFLFGEAETLYCQTRSVGPGVRGEDVATVMLHTAGGATVVCNLSYASRTEIERFPETFAFIEGERGSAELAPGASLRVTDENGTHSRRVPPPTYPWSDPAYALIHSSIVECHRNLAGALRDGTPAETTGADNLETLRLVYGAYESAARGSSLPVKSFPGQPDSHNLP